MTARAARSASQVFNSGRFAADGDPLAAEDISGLPYERRLEVLDAAPNGSLYIGFGFFVRVSGSHLRPFQLTPLRWIGDDAGDKAVLALKTARGANLPHADSLATLTSMRAHVRCAQAFVTEAETVPPWVDWDRVRRGQEFFLRNAGSLCVALLNLALIGGFGAPKINAVLQATGYLTRGKGTQRRLSETLQMVLDCIPDGALRPGGRGWHSVLNVRLLHAGVRTWLVGSQRTHKLPADSGVGSSRDMHGSDHLSASRKVSRDRHPHVGDGDHTLPNPAATTRTDDTTTGTATTGGLPNTLPDAGLQANTNCRGDICKCPSTCTCGSSGSAGSSHFDVAAYGVPINQEDLLVTQLAFSIVLLIGLERLGLLDAESASEMECYLHMWRYIGHLMGVEPRLNAAPMDTLGGAQAMLESIASHVVSSEPCARDITMHVLGSVSHKPPLPRSPLLHVALTRMLAGDWYADALGIPHLTDPDLLALDKVGRAELRKQAAASRVQTPGRGASSPFALPPSEEGADTHHAPAGAAAASSGASSKPWQSFDAAGAAMSGFGIAALLALAFAALRGAAYVWSLLTWTVAAVSAGRRTQLDAPAGGVEAAAAAARAQADARAAVMRLKIVQWFTHLPWVGLPIARLVLGGAVRVIELQLGGRTHFPVRKRYL